MPYLLLYFDANRFVVGKTEKLSLSQDSIDSTPSIGSHKRSKSILKNKSESSKGQTDPESERLLADNLSGAGISETGSVSIMLSFDQLLLV